MCSGACRLNITFSYNIPAVGEDRAKRIAATQEAVLRVRSDPYTINPETPQLHPFYTVSTVPLACGSLLENCVIQALSVLSY